MKLLASKCLLASFVEIPSNNCFTWNIHENGNMMPWYYDIICQKCANEHKYSVRLSGKMVPIMNQCIEWSVCVCIMDTQLAYGYAKGWMAKCVCTRIPCFSHSNRQMFIATMHSIIISESVVENRGGMIEQSGQNASKLWKSMNWDNSVCREWPED